MSYPGGTTGLCVACSGRFPIENGTITEHETAEADERESLREEALPGGAPPSRTENDAGPSPEEETRGAQPPNAVVSRSLGASASPICALGPLGGLGSCSSRVKLSAGRVSFAARRSLRSSRLRLVLGRWMRTGRLRRLRLSPRLARIRRFRDVAGPRLHWRIRDDRGCGLAHAKRIAPSTRDKTAQREFRVADAECAALFAA
jgi:hypothetical protein